MSSTVASALRRLGLADARLALEQQRLRQAEAEEHRRRQALVDEVVDRREPPGERLDVGDDPARPRPAASPVTSCSGRRRSCGRQLGEDGPVVLLGVDVARDRAGDRHLDDLGGALVEQPPDALVAVQVGERREVAAPEGDRVTAAVVIAADGERGVAAAGEQRRRPSPALTPG